MLAVKIPPPLAAEFRYGAVFVLEWLLLNVHYKPTY